jgi:hypothetical protein
MVNPDEREKEDAMRAKARRKKSLRRIRGTEYHPEIFALGKFAKACEGSFNF